MRMYTHYPAADDSHFRFLCQEVMMYRYFPHSEHDDTSDNHVHVDCPRCVSIGVKVVPVDPSRDSVPEQLELELDLI